MILVSGCFVSIHVSIHGVYYSSLDIKGLKTAKKKRRYPHASAPRKWRLGRQDTIAKENGGIRKRRQAIGAGWALRSACIVVN